ncbi:MAG: hypothetical protein JW883_03705 [Deltaproteobacteria bacterium]|nr:hypothetical protein [Deltaproteobacteria bacterium]
MPVSPAETTTYTITATGPGGTATDSVTVTVTSTTPTVTISANPESIQIGESSTLSWTSTNAQTAHIDNGIGVVSVNGSTIVSPEHTTTYTITVTGPTGSASAQATVSVTGNPEPQPEGSFGEQYEDLVPPDATVESYDAKRFSVITGLVQDLAGSRIADVSVTIHDHPEYGSVVTDADGRFSIPVEGGATITVVYQNDGLLAAQRKVYVPWNDIAIAETVVMVTQDPAGTTVTFDGNPDTVVTHQSTEVTDDFGSRACTMVFTGDNHAYLVDENGNDVHELTTVTTRATEYTTPESMPAILPPTSAYTYCVELAVDGAQRVRFEKPVITWVDNFLGFDVGMAVPVGYYDRDRGVWVPEDNGVVVRLLDTDIDGVVDALDADGDDLPDDLNNDSSFSDEVTGLDDPIRYPVDSTFWRVATSHFSPCDLNWAARLIESLVPLTPQGPEGSISPDPEGKVDVDEQKEKEGDCQGHISSFVEERGRIFHEDILVPGSNFTLHYASNRIDGYRYKIFVPASGDTLPEGLKRIIVKIQVAGQVLEQTLDPLPNRKAEFVWDGLNQLGRQVSGTTTVQAGVGFVYDAVYTIPPDLEQAFGMVGRDLTSVPVRAGDAVLWKWSSIPVAVNKGLRKGAIAEGWTISVHHSSSSLDPSTLHKGNGTMTRNDPQIITTVAGGGGSLDDGIPAVETSFYNLHGIAIDTFGNIYIAEYGRQRIRKVDTNGIITTVAGGGGSLDDGIPAVEAQLSSVYGVAVDASGDIYIADTYNHKVRKVDTNGIITTVAGGGGSLGDGGPAVEAHLSRPYGVAVDTSGNIYIADTYQNRIRKVDTKGIINTVAGTGSSGKVGDGGLAIWAQLYYPYDVAVDASGNIYVADTYNNRIRKVDKSGIIDIVAGVNFGGYSGDGGPAVGAQLYCPYDVEVDASGNLYIADAFNRRVRKVDTSGIITTLAGNGDGVFGGDGGPAVEASLTTPSGVAVDAAGNLYVADLNARRVRKVSIPSELSRFMAHGDIPFAEDNGMGYIMSSAGRHKMTIDLETGVTLFEFGYNVEKELVSITDRFGNQTTIDRDANGVPTAIVSPDGITTTLTVDGENHLTRITYPDGSYYGFEYTTDGLLTAKIEPDGNRFEHVFDAIGRLTDATDEEGGHWNYARTAYENGDILTEVLTGEGNLASYLDHTDSTGAYTSTISDSTTAQTLYSRSGDGLTVNKSLPCGMDLDFQYGIDSEYKFKRVKGAQERTPAALTRTTLREKTYEDTDADDIADLITKTVTVNGKVTTLANNVLQSQKTVTSPEGRTVTSTYDPATLVTSTLSIPGLYDTTYGYDTRGRLTSILTNTRETSFVYNAQGFLDSITDPEDHITYYTYDAVGRMTGISRPDTSTLGFTYDQNGNMTVLTNPNTIDHGFGYNAVNRNSAYQTPLSGSYTYIYDKDRRLIQTNFPSGNQINNIYANGRLEQIQTPENNIDLTYLCGTKVGSITNGTETITYGYDGKLVTSEALTGTLNESLGYSYNNEFNLNSFTYAGNTHIYTYDDDGLLTGAGGFTVFRNAGNGLPESVTGGVLSLARTFNGYGEVEEADFTVNGSSVTDWSLTRDDNGRITEKAETVDGVPSSYAYTYDAMGRLLTVTKDSTPVEEYRYSPNGTRTYEMNALREIAGRTFDYSDEDHLLTADGTSYEYNADGFLTTKTQGIDITTYDYSSRGELLSVTLPGSTVIDYVHDPLGRRIAKRVNDVTTEKYLWDGLTRLLAVFDGSDNLIMRFEYADGRMPVAMTKDGSTYYLTYDQVGSLRIVADASGTAVKRIDYDSFGNVINDTNLSFEIPFGFAGGLHDRDTGLVRFGFRDYDPDIGTWTAKDPIGFAGGDTDLYGYCLNDPILFVDPHGLKWYDKLTEIAAGAAIRPLIAKYVDSPAGQRIITAGLAGGAGGAVLGAVVGTPLLGVGAGPSALGGAIVGSAGNMLKQTVKEALGLPEIIGRTMSRIRERIQNREMSPCR